MRFFQQLNLLTSLRQHGLCVHKLYARGLCALILLLAATIASQSLASQRSTTGEGKNHEAKNRTASAAQTATQNRAPKHVPSDSARSTTLLRPSVLGNLETFGRLGRLGKWRLPDIVSNYHGTILPILTADGQRLYFDRKWHPENTGGEQDFDDIWYADKSPNTAPEAGFGKPTNLGAPLNTRGSDVLCSIAPDGAFALVYGRYDSATQGVKNPGFSITRAANAGNHHDKWSAPEPIEIEQFYNRAKKYYAHLAPDNRTLLLALEREDSRGGLDLYVSFRRDTSLSWSKPLHLGNSINTAMYEGSPFLAPDGKTLYFSSEGLSGLGAADVLVTRRLDDTWQNWSAPVNLGSSINTREEDSSVNLLLNGVGMYYVSSDATVANEKSKGLYFATLADSVQPSAALLLSGTVRLPATRFAPLSPTTSSNPELVTVAAYRLARTEQSSAQQRQRPLELAALSQVPVLLAQTARYALALPAGETYLVRASAPNRPSALLSLVTTPEKRFEERTHDFTLDFTRNFSGTGARTAFKQPTVVLFEQEHADVTHDAALALHGVQMLLSELPATDRSNARIEVVGHTCDLGSSASNDALSKQRAEAVATTLEQIGVEHAALRVSGQGERKPAQNGRSDEARRRNRRVEVRVVVAVKTPQP